MSSLGVATVARSAAGLLQLSSESVAVSNVSDLRSLELPQ
jgi:hypothetical protein